MKRKHETDAELTTNIDCGDADDFRDQLLEQEEFGRVIKRKSFSLTVNVFGKYCTHQMCCV